MKDQTQPVKDFTYIKDWCQTISTKFITLEKGIDRWKLRTATSNKDEDKSWINLNLQNIREEVNDITGMMNALQTSIMSRDIPSDYLKYATQELGYFMHEWKFKYTPALKEMFNENKEKETMCSNGSVKSVLTSKSQLSKLEESLKENQKLMNYIQSNIMATRQTVLNIQSVSEQSLKNIQQGRQRIKRVQKIRQAASKFKKFQFGFSIVFIILIAGGCGIFMLNFFSAINIL